jgi:hypothetical protein
MIRRECLMQADRSAHLGELEEGARELVKFALRHREDTGLPVAMLPEMLLLAAIELAAILDGTADGTIDWIEDVAGRLRQRSDR